MGIIIDSTQMDETADVYVDGTADANKVENVYVDGTLIWQKRYTITLNTANIRNAGISFNVTTSEGNNYSYTAGQSANVVFYLPKGATWSLSGTGNQYYIISDATENSSAYDSGGCYNGNISFSFANKTVEGPYTLNLGTTAVRSAILFNAGTGVNSISVYTRYGSSITYHSVAHGSTIYIRFGTQTAFIVNLSNWTTKYVCFTGYNYDIYMTSGNVTEYITFPSIARTVQLLINSVDFQYLGISIIGSGWNVRLRNNNNIDNSASYNRLLCFEDNAKTWTNLDHLEHLVINRYEYKDVTISINWFATDIATCFVFGGRRWITYGNNLAVNGGNFKTICI